ncbi:16S rRNA (cytosine967-C5)-methyltransferase [Rhizobium halophytocola]|uniref:16S rRNA (Cytosine967-C5)-methyltransferase n=1 Tax=Rhizobium halophytocola TaxID=735519 RepID=A0ABS4E1U2_9HYPH|nr:RsmB/NOP family class I SAM-dependent RNA methyltransferase [Rhizobium halophytocola]MBP1851869.1 16S rRNA (cytosine967-C5)-methyltransferase [Rhizobium halophytocola]
MNDAKHQKSKSGRSKHPAAGDISTASNRSLADKPGLETRAAAVKLLGAVVDRKTSLDGLLDPEGGNPAFTALPVADRALVRAILQTALRYLPRIEAILGSLLQSPLPEGARSLHHLLVVGACQILYLDIPDRSAVDLGVELANRDPRNRRFSKLVNALLRRISREKPALLETVNDIACVPDWFLQRLVEIYGAERARKIAEAQLVPAAIDLTVTSDAEGWAARLNGRVLPTGSVRLAAFSGAIPELEGFEDGAWWVQDAAASLPARLFGVIDGLRVADLCAAPGGKTAQLVLAGAEVTAVEQSVNRLKRLSANLARLGLDGDRLELRNADLLTLDPSEAFDAVLLDAPCSSTGTIRRHPDVLWTKGPADIAKLAGVQARLLRHAAALVRPGGLIVFSNCSLDPLEGEQLVETLLGERPDLQRRAIDRAAWPGLEAAITDKGEFRTTPDMIAPEGESVGGMDGFYACVLQRSL